MVVFSPQSQGQCGTVTENVSDPGPRTAAFGSGFISGSSHFVHQVLVPALMVTAGHDPVLLPSLSEGMEDMVRKTRLPIIERKPDAFVFRSRI